MAMIEHKYPVSVEWTGARDGHGTITAVNSEKAIPINVPPEFGGAGGLTNPEELLTSAISGCYSITFGIVAASRRLPIESFTLNAEGTVEQNGISFKFREIVLRPQIILKADATDEQISLTEEMAHKCDAYCIVTNAVRASVSVTIEPTVTRALFSLG